MGCRSLSSKIMCCQRMTGPSQTSLQMRLREKVMSCRSVFLCLSACPSLCAVRPATLLLHLGYKDAENCAHNLIMQPPLLYMSASACPRSWSMLPSTWTRYKDFHWAFDNLLHMEVSGRECQVSAKHLTICILVGCLQALSWSSTAEWWVHVSLVIVWLCLYDSPIFPKWAE